MKLKFTVTNGSRTVKVYKTELEYEVRLAGRPQATYYTDDYDDAVGTAKLMARPSVTSGQQEAGVLKG